MAHLQGGVDDDHIRKFRDVARKPRRRIVVREEDVLDCVRKIERLARAISAWPDRAPAHVPAPILQIVLGRVVPLGP